MSILDIRRQPHYKTYCSISTITFLSSLVAAAFHPMDLAIRPVFNYLPYLRATLTHHN